MSVYNVLVFAHILAAFLLIGGIVTQRFGLGLLRSASQGEVMGAFKTFRVAPRLIGPSAALTVLTGLTLAWFIGYTWRALWVSASVVLLIAIEVWRAVMLGPLLKRLEATAHQAFADPAAHTGALLALAKHPQFVWSYLAIDLATTTILALMVFKPMTF